MHLKFDIILRDDGEHVYEINLQHGQSEATVEHMRHTIAGIRQRLPTTPLVCDFTLYESIDPLNAPLKRRFIELLEHAQIQIVTVFIMHSTIFTELEERNELCAFLKTFQSHVTLFSISQAPNDFVLAWWFERVFGDTSFMPALVGFKLNLHTHLNGAIVLRLIEAFAQTAKSALLHVFFTPIVPPNMDEATYLAMLLQRAYENIVFTRNPMARSIGQYAYSVLAPMLPLHWPVVRLAVNPYEDDDETTVFIFDQHILTNGGISLNNMTLQQYTDARFQFSSLARLGRRVE